MSENRRKILDMLAEGKLSAGDAERLLAALDRERSSGPGSPGASSSGAAPKYLRVMVDELKDETHQPTKVDVRLPLQLLRAGIKLQSLLPPQVRGELNLALREKGISLDLNQIKAENVDELIAAFSDLTVDVDADGGRAKVKVFCE